MAELFYRVNWVDIIALILLIRISYTSSQIGVSKQLLPLILLVLILSFTLYTYRAIASFFIERYSFAPSVCEFLSYAIMAIILSIVYYFISHITGFFLSKEEGKTSGIEKVGGFFLGVLRSILIIGIIMIGLLLTPVKAIEGSVKNSYSGFFFISTNLKAYSTIMNMFLKSDDKKISYEKALSELAKEKESYMFKPLNLKEKSRFFQDDYKTWR